MSRRRFYATRVESTQAWIEGRPARHLADVLRAKPGQIYELAWSGRAWLGKISAVARDRVGFELLEELAPPPSGLIIDLAPAIVKFDAFEWTLEKATELGAAGIHPLITRRTDARLAEAAVKRMERWERLLVEATEQSRRTQPPVLYHPMPLRDYLREEAGEAGDVTRLIASELGEAIPLRQAIADAAGPSKALHRCAVLIGPEGGWTEEEVDAARAAGYSAVSLGPRILRAETAALAVLAVLQNCREEGTKEFGDAER